MDSNPLPPPEAQSSTPKSGRFNTRKLLLGCGCGCATLLTLSIVGILWAFNYLLGGPGVQIPSDYVLGPQTNAFIHIASASDAGPTRALFGTMVETLASIDPESIDQEQQPGIYQLVTSLQDFDEESISQALSYFPEQLTVAFEASPDPASQFDYTAAINLPVGSRFFRFIFEQFITDSSIVTEHGEHNIYSEFTALDELEPGQMQQVDLNTDQFFTFQRDTPLLGSSSSMLTQILDRTDFEDAPGPAPPSPQRASYEELSKRWLVSAGAGGEPRVPDGFIATWLSFLPPHLRPSSEYAEMWQQVQVGRFQIGCGVDGKDLSLRVAITGLKPTDVRRVQDGLDALFRDFADETPPEGDLLLTYESLAGEQEVVLNARLANFEKWVQARLNSLVQ